MAKTTLNMTSSLGSLRAALAWFLILLLGGEFIQLSSAVGSNVTVLSDFNFRVEKLRNYLCDYCSEQTTCSRPILFDNGCLFCQRLCQWSLNQRGSAEQTVCQTSDGSNWCDEDQSTDCAYKNEAEVCKYDDTDESCMYFYQSDQYPFDVISKYCVCDSEPRRLPVLEMSCSESTTITMETEMPPTGEPLTTVNGAATPTREPLTTVNRAAKPTGEPLTTAKVAAKPTGDALSMANVAAIVLGTVLAVLLIAVTLGLLCLFKTNRLKCGAGTGATTADASIEMAQNDNEGAQGQRSVVSTNAYEDASTRDGTTDNAYKSLHLSHEQSHYYSRIPEVGGNPDARTAQEEVTPSAPPMEGHKVDTEAQEGHEYFVLEREQSTQSKAENSNHEYFVLEKDEVSGEREVGRQEGAEDNDTHGREVDSTIVSKPVSTHEDYDHIKRPPQDNTTDNTYSHLNPNPGEEYDHLSRPGQK